MTTTEAILRNKNTRTISRFVVGVVFAFSGFVKLIDPLGSKYKFIDYFNAFDLGFLAPIALPLALILSVTEFMIGIGLLLNFRSKIATWGALIFMVIFTPLTLYLAIENPVTDCGCFGDALIITNWETFWKNIFIDVFVVLLLFNRHLFKPPYTPRTQWSGFGVIALLAVAFGIYTSTHLPPMDFRPYNEGTHIPDKMKIPEGKEEDQYGYDYTLRHKKTNAKKTLSSKAYMNQELWKDSLWEITKTSEPYLVKKGYTPPIHDLTMVATATPENANYAKGQDVLDDVLNDSTLSFWLIAHDLKAANKKAMKHANTIANFFIEHGKKFYCLTASGDDEIAKIRNTLHPPYQFFNTDPITLKTIVRSNPGYVLLQHGTILEKWHHNNPPTIEELQDEYQLAEQTN